MELIIENVTGTSPADSSTDSSDKDVSKDEKSKLLKDEKSELLSESTNTFFSKSTNTTVTKVERAIQLRIVERKA
jgi:hypothetical protein